MTAGPNRRPTTLASLISGSVGGAAQVLVGQPLDTIKTRSQIAPIGMFAGPIDVARKTIKQEGFLALYKGMFSPLIGVAGVNSLLFGAYTISKRIVSPFPDLTISQTALAGSMAGAVNSVLASPVEMLKIKMQAQYGTPNDMRLRHVIAELWREWGFRKGIMRGFWVTVVREIPAYAGFYAGFEFTKRAFQKWKFGSDHRSRHNHLPPPPLPVWAILASGAAGGIGYWTACYPLDVIKSRVQMADRPPQGINYIAETWRKICREEGPRALLRGLAPTCHIPASASTFVAYELTMEFLQSHTSL
ncbi:hypothetical protein CROQUDRAFT_47850 [Cronartium quercuum f. sp. fusiforme G11]|uniref:Mitochondrial carrier n=1 Tax=Cronartium quercuum f. sp. fusiforme G11 TaxID=708437 RepID=A0A9P6NH27_9BASI|nr:hypothetical protein CROQUDRAFT_47850 [Cronartium quercuum f. sp. fusiforme G11]